MLKDGEKGVVIQRDCETYAVAPHVPCGVISPEQLRKMADVAEKYQVAALKITSAARIAIVGLREEDVDAVWSELGMSPGAAVGICVRSVKACPGTTFCKRGQQDSLTVGMQLDAKYHGVEMPGKAKFGVSGCPNQCAENCIKDIGLIGKSRGWTVTVGGNGGPRPRLAKPLADNLSTEDALALLDKVVDYYKANANRMERIGRMIERIGFDEFKATLLA